MRLLPFILSAVVLTPITTAPQKTSAPETEQLVYALYVMRHGVRSPTGDAAQYQRFSSAAWPTWPVPPGYLTTHGYEAIKELGRYDREELATRGLLASDGCSDVDYVSIHADSDERTRQTARALAEGMFPSCKVAIRALEENANDELFHLSNASVSRKQAEAAADAVMNRVGNDPKSIAAAHHGQLADLDSLLAKCGTATPTNSRVSIFDVPATVVPGNDDHLVTMRGPVNIAGTLVENILLEYAEGMPIRDVGWGCVDGMKLRELINLHTEASDLTQRTPEVAVPQAAALLRTINRSITQAATGQSIAGAEGKPGDKVLVLVGHDTNLNNLAGALRLHWMLDGRKDDTPPGSALVFELWKNLRLKTYVVRASYTTQTLEQMRNVTQLTSRNPPQRVSVFLPTCSQTNLGCDVASFEQMLESASINVAKSSFQESTDKRTRR